MSIHLERERERRWTNIYHLFFFFFFRIYELARALTGMACMRDFLNNKTLRTSVHADLFQIFDFSRQCSRLYVTAASKALVNSKAIKQNISLTSHTNVYVLCHSAVKHMLRWGKKVWTARAAAAIMCARMSHDHNRSRKRASTTICFGGLDQHLSLRLASEKSNLYTLYVKFVWNGRIANWNQ